MPPTAAFKIGENGWDPWIAITIVSQWHSSSVKHGRCSCYDMLPELTLTTDGSNG